MIEFGESLRQAREARGYTVAQLAETTRMAPKTVTELESENFSHIAAPIYGRGFVKLYCEAVGLEAKPFIDEFMAIYRGERDVGIRERDVREAPTTEAPPVTAPEPPP
ncbi:MAG: helix-turn-helix domain-containing protein, partial [Kiritimatiellae bacterium]|nr:helix-turn-helix domain-containing protein [Kiritimatiellia bacterium]